MRQFGPPLLGAADEVSVKNRPFLGRGGDEPQHLQAVLDQFQWVPPSWRTTFREAVLQEGNPSLARLMLPIPQAYARVRQFVFVEPGL